MKHTLSRFLRRDYSLRYYDDFQQVMLWALLRWIPTITPFPRRDYLLRYYDDFIHVMLWEILQGGTLLNAITTLTGVLHYICPSNRYPLLQTSSGDPAPPTPGRIIDYFYSPQLRHHLPSAPAT